MDWENSPAFVFLKNGRSYKLTPQEVFVSQEYIKNFAANTKIHINNIFNLPNYGRVNATIQNESSLYIVRLHHLNLKSFFTVKDDFFVPKFINPKMPAASSYFQLDLVWHLIPNMRLYFITEISNIDPRWLNSYLLAKHPTISGDWRLPLPNYFDSGELCLGDNSVNNPEFLKIKISSEIMNACLDIFYKNNWNADLGPSESMSTELFRFNMTDNSQIKPPEDFDWTKFATRFSNEKLVDCNLRGL